MIKSPPGKLLNSRNICPNTVGLFNDINMNSFFEKRLPSPFANAKITDLQLNLNILFFANNGITKVNIYYQCVLNDSGTQRINFYIEYDNSDPLREIEYAMSKVDNIILSKSNALPEFIDLNKPIDIAVFLWDEDPVTSRGTVTTVQPS
ncbi:hypothetical protein [Aquimarina aggregata]|uniref:hypothetical protein n=1 Tax=Aquimarina aggregata TaxID=1642818 RepID=UPI0024920222|nr:hypothetical protein [Aquimarina aggregata]